jgi:hypothetical protein
LHSDEVDEEIEDVVFIDCPLKNQIDAITAVKNLKTYANNQGDLRGYELATKMETYYANSMFEAKHNRQTTLLHFFPERVDISTYSECLTFLITYTFYLFIISIKRTPLLSGQISCHDRCPLIGDFTVLLYSCHIVRKFLNIDTEHNTQQSQNAEARRR